MLYVGHSQISDSQRRLLRTLPSTRMALDLRLLKIQTAFEKRKKKNVTLDNKQPEHTRLWWVSKHVYTYRSDLL